MKLLIATAAASLLLAGCAPSHIVRLTVHSVPEGAAIIQDGAVIGTTPTVITYNAKPAFRSGQCLTIRPLTARWASGAAVSWPGQLCPSTGYAPQYTFMRPANAPNALVDAQVGAGAAMQAAAVAQAQAQSDAQWDAFWAGAIMSTPVAPTYVPPPRYPAVPPATYQTSVQPFSAPPVQCTSTELAGTVSTTCH